MVLCSMFCQLEEVKSGKNKVHKGGDLGRKLFLSLLFEYNASGQNLLRIQELCFRGWGCRSVAECLPRMH